MARRDIEKIIGELGEIRRMLTDPHTGITALHQVQESRRSKVLELEHVTYSTTGVREENRELRRRQERMLSDLGQARTAVDDLRHEIAHAWAHTLRLPHISTTGPVGPAEDALPVRQTPAALEAGQGHDDERKDHTRVPDEHAPDAAMVTTAAVLRGSDLPARGEWSGLVAVHLLQLTTHLLGLPRAVEQPQYTRPLFEHLS